MGSAEWAFLILSIERVHFQFQGRLVFFFSFLFKFKIILY